MLAKAARAVCATALLLGACGDDEEAADPGDGSVMDASDAPRGGRGGSGGGGGSADASAAATGGGGSGGSTAPTAGPVECAGSPCTVDVDAMNMGIAPCCTADDACGASTPLNPGTCLLTGRPGGPDLSCTEFVLQGFITWGGCCTPEGQCGALDTGTFGCIPNADLGLPESSCTPDPDNTCERLVEVVCDGAEDCPGDQVCCGQYLDGYRRFVCRDDCQAAETDEGGIWSDVCHPGDACPVDGYSCRANATFLPDFLYRCRDTGDPPTAVGSTAAGEINCGAELCGADQKCCLSVPGEPRCVARSEACTCYQPEPPPGSDGGADHGDAG